jgi:hypothetical protein
LWGSLVAGDAHPILHHAGLEEAPHDAEEALVADPTRHSGHQDIVIDPAEKFLQIQIDDDLAPLLGYVFPRLF